MDSPLSPASSTAATTPLASALFPPIILPEKHSALLDQTPPRDGRQSSEPPAIRHQSLEPPSSLLEPPEPLTSSATPSSAPDSETQSLCIPENPPPPTSTSKPHRHCLTRDQRRDILLMRSLGHTYHQICKHLNLPFGAVQYTCQKRSASPKRRPGRAKRLTDEKLNEIETFITSSIENRQLTYQEVVETLGLDVKEDTLTQALRKRGLVRQMAFLKSPLAVGNITAKPIRTYLTCRRNEEIDSPQVVEIIKRRNG